MIGAIRSHVLCWVRDESCLGNPDCAFRLPRVVYAGRGRGRKIKFVNGKDWIISGNSERMKCHAGAAGFAPGPETTQLNGHCPYPKTGITAEWLFGRDSIGYLSQPLADAPANLPALADPEDVNADIKDRRAPECTPIVPSVIAQAVPHPRIWTGAIALPRRIPMPVMWPQPPIGQAYPGGCLSIPGNQSWSVAPFAWMPRAPGCHGYGAHGFEPGGCRGSGVDFAMDEAACRMSKIQTVDRDPDCPRSEITTPRDFFGSRGPSRNSTGNKCSILRVRFDKE